MKSTANDPTPEQVLSDVYRLEAERFEVQPTKRSSFEKEDVVYGSVEGRDLIGTLYTPRDEPGTPKPSVVYIHGGGWRSGSRGQFPRHAAAMTSRGFAGLCIDYRLSGESPYPAAIQDAKCAVRYLRANADRLCLDPSRIGAAGGSAGGHLSACLATTGGKSRPEWEGMGGHQDHDSSIQAAVLLNGEFDLRTWWDHGKCNELMTTFLQKTYEEAPDLYRDASPINHVNGETCPCLLIHGEEDQAVPISQSTDFRDRILSVGGCAEMITVPDAGHAWFNHDPHFKPCLEAMMKFFVERLGEDKR